MLLKESGDTAAEKEGLANLDKISRKIMFLLVDVEQKTGGCAFIRTVDFHFKSCWRYI
jgi:hypothetical protein